MGNSVSPTRRQRPRGSITREAVVFAALAVVDRQGPQALTIRSVARQVGAPPMSLYTHFANKDELMDLMVSEIVRHLYRDNGNATWQSSSKRSAGVSTPSCSSTRTRRRSSRARSRPVMPPSGSGCSP